MVAFWIFSWAVIFDGGRDESLVGAWTVEYFPEVWPSGEIFGGSWVEWFLYFFNLHGSILKGFDEAFLENIIFEVDWLFIHELGFIRIHGIILFIHLIYDYDNTKYV